MQAQIHRIYIKDVVYDYILRLVTATRDHPMIDKGASPRATIALVKTAKAYAWLQGRHYVIPSDVAAQLPYVLLHRITLSMGARMNGSTKNEIVADLIKKVPVPYLGASK